MIIVSACLAGVHCRYDANDKAHPTVMHLVAEGKAIPLCPEQLGGLSTPRAPAEIQNGHVVNKAGQEVTEQFQHGAAEACQVALMIGAKQAILKSRSPSCGCGKVYDGTFSGKLVSGDGVFSTLCKENGIAVISEEELEGQERDCGGFSS